jgi:hypothetical protein
VVQSKQEWRRVTVPIPEQFRVEARSQRRSLSNLARIAFEDYLQRRGTAPQPDKQQNIRQDTASP